LDKKLEARFDFQRNDGLVDAYLRWKPIPWLSVTIAKTKPLIGQYDFLEHAEDDSYNGFTLLTGLRLSF
jgi:hypothetical protein